MKAFSLNVIPFRNMRTHAVRTFILLLLVMAQAACAFGGLMLMTGLRLELTRADARHLSIRRDEQDIGQNTDYAGHSCGNPEIQVDA